MIPCIFLCGPRPLQVGFDLEKKPTNPRSSMKHLLDVAREAVALNLDSFLQL